MALVFSKEQLCGPLLLDPPPFNNHVFHQQLCLTAYEKIHRYLTEGGGGGGAAQVLVHESGGGGGGAAAQVSVHESGGRVIKILLRSIAGGMQVGEICL